MWSNPRRRYLPLRRSVVAVSHGWSFQFLIPLDPNSFREARLLYIEGTTSTYLTQNHTCKVDSSLFAHIDIRSAPGQLLRTGLTTSHLELCR
jgi:hypothetical protein